MVTMQAWLSNTLANSPTLHRFVVHDCSLTYLAWGNPNHPPLLFLHGGYANAQWFSHIAPHFTDQYYVCALNFSGHGLSDWRDQYQIMDFVDELAGCIAQLNHQPLTLIGHSFGARIAYLYSRLREHQLAYLCLLDPPEVTQTHITLRQELKKSRVQTFYRDPQALIQRFRLIPSQPIYHPEIVEHVAKNSIICTPEGYRWQTDINLFAKFLPADIPQNHIACGAPVCDLIYGEFSEITTAAVRETLHAQLPAMQMISLTDAHHALMLDQPQTLIQQLKDRILHHSQVVSHAG